MDGVRIGYGEDAHRLVAGRRLLIGGVLIEESERGSQAHSDGDVLLHAVADALLSAWSLGDIGRLFPPGDERYRDLDGSALLRAVISRVRRVAGRFGLLNVSAVVTLDAPALGPHREAMVRRLAELLGTEPGRVGVTFKTSEGLAPDHVQARVTLLASAASAC